MPRRDRHWLVFDKQCSVCGRAGVLARGFCPTHYKAWRLENVPGAYEAAVRYNREYSRQHRKELPGLDQRERKAYYAEKNLRQVAALADWYVIRAMRLPKDSPPELIAAARQYIQVRRTLRGRL